MVPFACAAKSGATLRLPAPKTLALCAGPPSWAACALISRPILCVDASSATPIVSRISCRAELSAVPGKSSARVVMQNEAIRSVSLCAWTDEGPQAAIIHVRRRRTSLVLDVLEHAPHRSLRGIEGAGRIDGDPFAHGPFGRIGLMRRNEHRHLAVLQAADADALEPARVPLRRRFGVGRIDR